MQIRTQKAEVLRQIQAIAKRQKTGGMPTKAAELLAGNNKLVLQMEQRNRAEKVRRAGCDALCCAGHLWFVAASCSSALMQPQAGAGTPQLAATRVAFAAARAGARWCWNMQALPATHGIARSINRSGSSSSIADAASAELLPLHIRQRSRAAHVHRSFCALALLHVCAFTCC